MTPTEAPKATMANGHGMGKGVRRRVSPARLGTEAEPRTDSDTLLCWVPGLVEGSGIRSGYGGLAYGHVLHFSDGQLAVRKLVEDRAAVQCAEPGCTAGMREVT